MWELETGYWQMLCIPAAIFLFALEWAFAQPEVKVITGTFAVGFLLQPVVFAWLEMWLAIEGETPWY